jgi:Rieske Fe-S protein
MSERIDDSAVTSRRVVLAGAGAAGTLTALGACGSSSTGGNTGAPPATGAGTTAPGTTAPSGSQAPVVTSGPLGPTSDIPVGGGKVFTAQKIVVTQPTAGAFKAFTAICTHMGCTVASVSNGIIQCPCHGSQYSITDGSVKHGPAPLPLAAKTVTVQGSELVLG